MAVGLMLLGNAVLPFPGTPPLSLPAPALMHNAQAVPSTTTVRTGGARPILQVNGKPFMPIGVTYHFTRHQSSWASDLSRMVEMGLNTVRIDLGWRDVEPYWEGFYDFSVLDRFLDQAQAYGLKVVPVLSHATMDYNTPPWFWLGNRGWRVTRWDGKPMLGDFPSINHPGYRQAFGDYVRVTVEHIRNHPAVLAYQVLNEPHYSQGELGDYNPYTIKRFRQWLRDRYGSIEALNDAWTMMYSSFDIVQPERMPPVSDAIWDPHAVRWADWRQFTYQNLTEFVDYLNGIAREADPGHMVLVAEMTWWWWGEQPYTGVSPTDIYRSADVVGFDIYPERLHDQYYMSLNADMLSRFWDKPVWVTEFNTKDGKATGEEISSFVERAIEGGATGIFFFGWRDNLRDGGSYGLLDMLGRPKNQYAEYKSVVRWLRDHEGHLVEKDLAEPDVLLIWPSRAVEVQRGSSSPAHALYREARRLIEQGMRVGVLADIRLAPEDTMPPAPIPQRYGGTPLLPVVR